MGTPIDFHGANVTLLPPAGDDTVAPLHAYRNGRTIVSCWQLSPEEIEEVIRSGGKVWLSIDGRLTAPPAFVGSEGAVRQLNADVGVPPRK